MKGKVNKSFCVLVIHPRRILRARLGAYGNWRFIRECLLHKEAWFIGACGGVVNHCTVPLHKLAPEGRFNYRWDFDRKGVDIFVKAVRTFWGRWRQWRKGICSERKTQYGEHYECFFHGFAEVLVGEDTAAFFFFPIKAVVMRSAPTVKKVIIRHVSSIFHTSTSKSRPTTNPTSTPP